MLSSWTASLSAKKIHLKHLRILPPLSQVFILTLVSECVCHFWKDSNLFSTANFLWKLQNSFICCPLLKAGSICEVITKWLRFEWNSEVEWNSQSNAPAQAGHLEPLGCPGTYPNIFWDLQGWRFHHPSRAPIPMLCHPHNKKKKVFPYVQQEHPMF